MSAQPPDAVDARRATGAGTGVILLLVGSVGFALAPTFSSLARDDWAGSLGALLRRFAIATLLMFALRPVLARGSRLPRGMLFARLFAMGAIGYFLAAALFFTALRTMDSGLAIVIWYCNPILVVVAAWIFRGTRPGRVLVLCVLLSVTGVGVAAGQLGGAELPAVLYVLGSSVAYVFYTLTGERVLHHTDLVSATAVVFLGATCSLALLGASGLGDFAGPEGAAGWIAILGFAVVATVIPTVLMFEGLRRIGAGKASVVGAVEPVSTILFGVAILGESITVLRVIGATLVIAAVVILALGENRAAIAVTAQ